MARPKGQTNKVKKETAFKDVKTALKHLSYSELEETIAYALRFKKEKLGVEELRLIKEKEQIEQRLNSLRSLDEKMN